MLDHFVVLFLIFIHSLVASFQIFIQEPVSVNVPTNISWIIGVDDPPVFGIRQRLSDSASAEVVPFAPAATNTSVTFSQSGFYFVEIVSTSPTILEADTVFATSDGFTVVSSRVPDKVVKTSSVSTQKTSVNSTPAQTSSSSTRLSPSHTSVSRAKWTSYSSITNEPAIIPVVTRSFVAFKTERESLDPVSSHPGEIDGVQPSRHEGTIGLSKVQVGAIAGSIGGAVLFGALVVYISCYHRKRRENRESMQHLYVPSRSAQRTPSFLQSSDQVMDDISFIQYRPDDQGRLSNAGWYHDEPQMGL